MNKGQEKESYLKVYPSYFQFNAVFYPLSHLLSFPGGPVAEIQSQDIVLTFVFYRCQLLRHISLNTNFPLASIFKSMTSFLSVIIVMKLSKARHEKTKINF